MNSSQPLVTDRADEIDFVAFLRVLWERKVAIFVITAVIGLASLYYALTAAHLYGAQVIVTKVSGANMEGAASLASQFGGLASIAGVNLEGAGPGRQAQAVLESRYLIEEFIRRNDVLAELSPEGDDSLTLWFAVKRFQELILTIREDATDGKTTVAISWTDPVVAAHWANQFVALANEFMRARALEEATRNIEYLNEQIGNTNVVEVQRVMYNLIEQETKTLMLANAREEYAFTVVDPAVAPEIRTSPRRKLIVLTGGALGLFVSVILVFLWNLILQVRSNE